MSFLQRVTRYTAGATNQRENRLTEVTAAVIDEVDGLATAFASVLLCACAAGPRPSPAAALLAGLTSPVVRVSTQLSVSGGYVDLALSITSGDHADARSLLVWIENKHGAELSGNQLDVYRVQISSIGATESALIVLAPRGSEPAQNAVPSTTWQRVAEGLRAWSKAESLPPAHRWLLDEYFDYLREEQLMDPDGLNAAHAVALSSIGEAFDALTAVENAAAPLIASSLGQKPRRERNPDFYYAFEQPVWDEGEWGAVFPEWGLQQTSKMLYSEQSPRGEWAFYAGLSFNNSSKVLASAALTEWRGVLAGLGFQWLHFGSRYRLVRLLYPEQLLGATTTAEQGVALSEFVLEAFRVAPKPPEAVPEK